MGATAASGDAAQPLGLCSVRGFRLCLVDIAVGPASARVLRYMDACGGPDTAASAGLTRPRPGLRADAEPEQADIDLSVAALLAKRHRTHRLVRPSM